MKVKPLEWHRVGRSERWRAETVEGAVTVGRQYRLDGPGTEWGWAGNFAVSTPSVGPFTTAEEAKAAVERWHAARVMEWVEGGSAPSRCRMKDEQPPVGA